MGEHILIFLWRHRLHKGFTLGKALQHLPHSLLVSGGLVTEKPVGIRKKLTASYNVSAVSLSTKHT